MALFNFECENCGEVFEDDQSLESTEMGHEVLCPECGGFARKLFSDCLKCKHGSWSEWRLGLGNKE